MLMAAVVALWTVTSGSVLYIRTMYNDRVKDRDQIIAKYESRITKLEADKEEILKTRERTITLMQESVNTQKQQFEVLEAMYEKVADAQPRRRGGD